jgi:hypothetical protein
MRKVQKAYSMPVLLAGREQARFRAVSTPARHDAVVRRSSGAAGKGQPMQTGPRFTVERRPLVQTQIAPVRTLRLADGTVFLDFGRAAFGTLLVPSTRSRRLIVHLGEKQAADGRIDRAPGGTIRYARIEQEAAPVGQATRIVIPPDARNTGPAAIRMPPEMGEVYPFRYAEIEPADGIDGGAVRQIAFHYPFDDNASAFESSDRLLNAVWDLCKYSIKATTFCGVYVDGDRERIPYEGDAYINQLGHYCVDREYALARYTHEYLIQYPTWPTEWQLNSVMMAWADYLYSGEATSLETFYEDLCVKTLIDLAREDGLISTESPLRTRALEERLHLYHDRYIFNQGLRDLVDWPKGGGSFTPGGTGERDGHEMMPVNTVVNALHAHALALMSQIAGALGREGDRTRFAQQAARVEAAINRLLFDPARGVYVDGEGTTHASLHSNMFMLAFDMVPEARRGSVVAFVKSRGMACSVYGSQYLLEALYRHGEDRYALELMTAKGDRSWRHMLESGATITWEAWDWKYKNNLDWNHAWGAAPANIIPRWLMGVRPLEPGFARVLIQPRPGGLERASVRVPTPRGAVAACFASLPGAAFRLEVEIPPAVSARVALPLLCGQAAEVQLDGRRVKPELAGGFACVDGVGPGRHALELRREEEGSR